MLRRRGLLGAALGLMAAPALVKVEAIMPVRSWSPVADWIEREMERGGLVTGEFRVERPLRFLRGGRSQMIDATLSFAPSAGDDRPWLEFRGIQHVVLRNVDCRFPPDSERAAIAHMEGMVHG